MKNINLKIFVAYHQPCEMYEDDIFVPIQVGKKISKLNLGILSDDTGDNISDLNDKYCELTAQYRVWKNYDLTNVDYIGFFHYRRFFSYTCGPNIFNLINKFGINRSCYNAYMDHLRILSRDKVDFRKLGLEISSYISQKRLNIYLPRYYYTLVGKPLKCLCSSNEEIRSLILRCIMEMTPLYYGSTIDVINRNRKYNHRNMFIMDKNYFLKYMDFQFKILFRLYDLLEEFNLQKADFGGKRIMGYYSESFINLFTAFEEKYNKCRVSRDANILFLED